MFIRELEEVGFIVFSEGMGLWMGMQIWTWRRLVVMIDGWMDGWSLCLLILNWIELNWVEKWRSGGQKEKG